MNINDRITTIERDVLRQRPMIRDRQICKLGHDRNLSRLRPFIRDVEVLGLQAHVLSVTRLENESQGIDDR
ncbi:hypothetical protein D3C84_1020060 [compost metagenome]